MPSMLSSLTLSRKQLESCGRGVPALNSVGDAWVKSRCDMRSYDSTALSMSLCTKHNRPKQIKVTKRTKTDKGSEKKHEQVGRQDRRTEKLSMSLRTYPSRLGSRPQHNREEKHEKVHKVSKYDTKEKQSMEE